jgi:hypothetical protein
MLFGAGDVRALFRQFGVAVTFAGVSTYPDTGELVLGIFDRPIDFKEAEGGFAGIENPVPELRLPFCAFATMPQSGDTITVAGTTYMVSQPSAEDDGAILCYSLHLTS